jgi:hypothetical protein
LRRRGEKYQLAEPPPTLEILETPAGSRVALPNGRFAIQA